MFKIVNGWNNAFKSTTDLEVFFCLFERKVISKTKWSVIQYMKEILEVLDHRERAESIVSWSGLHLKYNAIFFYAGEGKSASCQFFAASSERMEAFFTPRVQWKLWKVHLNYPIDTYRDNSCTTSDRFVNWTAASETHQRESNIFIIQQNNRSVKDRSFSRKIESERSFLYL